jgi:RNA polymerase sigma-70 factor (ECF subfamily)
MSESQRSQMTRLVVDNQAALYRYAYRLTGNTVDAEDLTQQTFLQAQTSLHQLRDVNQARGWLFTILRNCFLKSQRKWAPAPETDLRTSLANLPERLAETTIDQERLQAGLDELPAEFKVVLLMYYFEEFSYREIAERLNLPLGTVMSRLSRGKRHLRTRLFEPELEATRSADQRPY